MKKFMTDEGQVEKAYLNGYFFGDRLLEDVYFECTIVDDEIRVLGVIDEDKQYFSQLNEAMWLAAAQACATDRDIFATKDGEDVWIEEGE